MPISQLTPFRRQKLTLWASIDSDFENHHHALHEGNVILSKVREGLMNNAGNVVRENYDHSNTST